MLRVTGTRSLGIRLLGTGFLAMFAVLARAPSAGAFPAFAEASIGEPDSIPDSSLAEIQNYIADAFGETEWDAPTRNYSVATGRVILAAA